MKTESTLVVCYQRHIQNLPPPSSSSHGLGPLCWSGISKSDTFYLSAGGKRKIHAIITLKKPPVGPIYPLQYRSDPYWQVFFFFFFWHVCFFSESTHYMIVYCRLVVIPRFFLFEDCISSFVCFCPPLSKRFPTNTLSHSLKIHFGDVYVALYLRASQCLA